MCFIKIFLPPSGKYVFLPMSFLIFFALKKALSDNNTIQTNITATFPFLL